MRRLIRYFQRRSSPKVKVFSQVKIKPEKLLMVAYYDESGLGTIKENVERWCSLSEYQIDLLNLYYVRHTDRLNIPSEIDLSQYHGIIVHCTISYEPLNVLSLDKFLKKPLKDLDNVKILMKQDEQNKTFMLKQIYQHLGTDILLTCLDESIAAEIYGIEQRSEKLVRRILTGYVSDELVQFKRKPFGARDVDIVYRGSMQPLKFGRICFEKFSIGRDVKSYTQKHHPDLSVDISSEWADRIHGPQWLEFIGNAKTTLGVESGASVFDFDGNLDRDIEKYMQTHPGAEFDEIEREILMAQYGKVDYNQISPRHFEAAACGTLQILFPGNYSGLFKAGVHYLELERDMSNIEDVLQRSLDPVVWKRMTQAALDDIILNPENSYASFVRRFDADFTAVLSEHRRRSCR